MRVLLCCFVVAGVVLKGSWTFAMPAIVTAGCPEGEQVFCCGGGTIHSNCNHYFGPPPYVRGRDGSRIELDVQNPPPPFVAPIPPSVDRQLTSYCICARDTEAAASDSKKREAALQDCIDVGRPLNQASFTGQFACFPLGILIELLVSPSYTQ